MKKTIKLTVLICILLLSFAVIFTACNNSEETIPGDTSETDETGTSTETNNNNTSQEPSEPVHQHVWGEWQVTQRASCLTGEGSQERHCESCEEVEYEVLYVSGHIEIVIPGKAATCTESGVSDEIMCVECKQIIVEKEEIPATGHFEVDVEAKAATCTEPGHTAGKKCYLCNKVTTTVVPAKGHVKEKIPGTPATCIANGITDGEKCKNCDYKKDGEIIFAGEEYHSFEEGECIWCEAEEPVHQHVWGEWQVTQRASCLTGEGSQERHCESCEEVEYEVLYVSGHIEIVVPGKAATCTEKGFSEEIMCVECKQILVEKEELPETGHYFEVDVEAKAATCTEPGHTAGKKCYLCNKVTTTVVPAKGHVKEKIPGTPATCIEDGVTDGEKCKNCDYKKDGEIILAGEEYHSYEEGECIWCQAEEPETQEPGNE